MATTADAAGGAGPPAQLEPVKVLYCEKCGLPPEYCEYVEDYEKLCVPWLKKAYPEVHARITALRMDRPAVAAVSSGGLDNGDGGGDATTKNDARPIAAAPWTVEERLTKFYELYVPEKVSDIPSLLEKYAGKEDKLFLALAKKYGPEPEDPYYMDSEDDDDDSDDDDGDDDKSTGGDAVDEAAAGVDGLQIGEAGGKKRRGVRAKVAEAVETRVIIQKLTRSKRKTTTVIIGMETVPGIKLKDVSKAFSKRFAGSSSVKDGVRGKEIIIQGDHMEDVADMIVTTFQVPGAAVFMDFDGDFVPYA